MVSIIEPIPKLELDHPNEKSKVEKPKKRNHPIFYYNIDDDLDYNADQVRDECVKAYNEAIMDCMYEIRKHRPNLWDKPLVKDMESILYKVIIT